MVVRIPNNEPARLERVHNTRWLKMGLDKQALADQVHEKTRDKQAEADELRRQGALRDAQAQAAELVHQREKEAFTQAAKLLQKERQEKQGLPLGRDWDLSRPDQLRIDCPARIGEDDPRCGPASIQKFAGEDLLASMHNWQHQRENAVIWRAQLEQMKRQKQAEIAAGHADEAQVRQRDALQQALMREEDLAQQSAAINTQQANKDLQEQRNQAFVAEILSEKAADIAELQTAIHSAFLNETSAHPELDSLSRVQIADFKGLSKERVQAIRDELERQLADKKAAHQQYVEVEKAHAQATALCHAQLRRQLLEAEMAKLRHQQKYNLYLEQQAEEKKQRDTEIAALFANKVTADYFGQFETSHR